MNKTQIINYVEKYLSPYIFGYRKQCLHVFPHIYLVSPYIFGYSKGHSVEQCLLQMLQIRKKGADEKRFAGAIL